MRAILIAIAWWISLLPVGAANHCVRSGASGTGADWTDAFGDLPVSLVRGDTYFVADGTYTAHTFNDAESGASLITIRKATAGDHGTATGWDAAYGDGQATFGQFQVQTGYLTVDGQTRSADWWSGYGIRIMETTGNFGCVRLSSASALSYVTFQYVAFEGGSRTDPALVESAVYAFATGRMNHVTISHCNTSKVWPDVFIVKGDDLLVEYCAIDENFSTEAFHGQIVAHHDCDRATFRYNKVRNPWGTAVYTVLGNGQTNTGLEIYGNVIWQDPAKASPDGISAFVEVIQTATVNAARVHHNTLANVGYNPRIVHVDATGSDRLAYNNLFYNCGSGENVTHANWAVDYSWYFGTLHDAEAHEQTGSDSPFVSEAGENFELRANTTPGLTLDAAYGTDAKGRLRATWTRGAYEFGATLNVSTFNFGN